MKKQIITFHPTLHTFAEGTPTLANLKNTKTTGKIPLPGRANGISDLGPTPYHIGTNTLTPADIDNLILIANGIKPQTLKTQRRKNSKNHHVGASSRRGKKKTTKNPTKPKKTRTFAAEMKYTYYDTKNYPPPIKRMGISELQPI